MSALHTGKNHIVLQTLARSLVAEICKAEVSLKLMARIMDRTAVLAV